MSIKTKTTRRSTLVLHRTASKNGHTGFEELKNLIKDGSDFTKEIFNIIQERSELEAAYSKGVSKLATKLFKVCKENSGTVSNAWHFVANDYEQTAEIHKTVAVALLEEIVKPLKVFGEIQYKSRKATEALVEKRHKQLQEWRATEAKAKAKSYVACRENEKCQDQLLDCKLGRGRQLSDKEHIKLQTKRKKSETAVRKSDMEYYAACIKAERSRLDWEGSVKRGVTVLRRLEEERLTQMKSMSSLYLTVMETHRPKLVALTTRLREPVHLCDVSKDMQELKGEGGDGEEGMGIQLLPHFYCEDLMNVMNRERRREALAKFVGIIKADIERERKGRAGVENLAKALQETPKFGGEESQQDVQDKLQHMRSMMTYLEASRFKALNIMMDVESRPRVTHPMSAYIDYTKDKQGLTTASLRLPSWVKVDPLPPLPSPDLDMEPVTTHTKLDWTDRGTADGGSPDSHQGNRSPRLTTTLGVSDSSPFFTTLNPITMVPREVEGTLMFRGRGDGSVEDDEDRIDISDINELGRENDTETCTDMDTHGNDTNTPDSDFDDFDDSADEVEDTEGAGDSEEVSEEITHNSRDNEIHEIYYQEKQVAVIGQCRAIYDYEANMYDELTIKYGDLINIHDKQEDGWWLGELNGKVGIFPATYVELP